MEKRIIEKLALRIAELEMNLAMAQVKNEEMRLAIDDLKGDSKERE